MSVTSSVRRHFPCALLFLSLSTSLTPSVRATIAKPTDLRTMVRKADLVFTGKVLEQRTEWTNQNGRKAIVTVVSFEVLDVHKGNAGRKLDLRCPGGTIGETTLELVGMPTFQEGERCVLFVRTNASAVCPIIGIYHGKLLLQKTADGAEETVTRHNGRPLSDMSQIGKDEDGAMASAVAKDARAAGRITLSQLKERIGEEVKSTTSAPEGK